MATKTKLKAHVILPNDEAYNTLKTTGTYSQGDVSITYDPKTTVYLTPGTGGSGAGLSANMAVVTDGNGKIIDSGVTAAEIGFLTNVRSNIQEQIDAITASVGTGTGNYFADSFANIDYTKPGNWYIDDGAGTYYHGVVDDDGKFKMIAAGVTPDAVGATDLSAYQKKTDTSINVTNTTGTKVSTVVNGLNTLEAKIGTGWPLSTTNQTLATAINELATKVTGTSGTTGSVTLTGTKGITTTTVTTGNYNIAHSNDFAAPRTLGSALHGRCTLPIPYVDQWGHVNPTASSLVTAYIPTTGGSQGQAWLYDAANSKGYWGAAGGTYTLPAATGTTLGGVKIGTGITVAADGTISATGGAGNQVTYTPAAGSSSTATTVQAAIDQLEARVKALEAKIATFSYDATNEVLSITTP